jgi:hypothetical protein
MHPDMPLFPTPEEMRMYAELAQEQMKTLSRKTKLFINIYALLVVHGIFVGIGNILEWIYG